MNKYLMAAFSAAFLSVGLVTAADETTMKDVRLNPPEGMIRSLRGQPTGAYGASRVETKLNVEVKDGVDKVHFIRDFSDPFVVTKAYIIKNANPYVLRGVLKTIVAGSLMDSPVAIETIEYADGVGALLIAAEEYRFKDAGNGMSMDQLVASLDKKGLPNSSGTVDMAYFPKYNRAEKLLTMMMESGIGFTGIAQAVTIASNSEYSNAFTFNNNGLNVLPFAYGEADENMNAIIMTAPGFDMREGLEFLKEIDTPNEEILLTYKLIEVYAENDQKLGLDFQAWKNNDGIDLFSAGGKYGTNWNQGLTPNNGFRYSEFYNFNPKWNTKYLDFLTVCGKAKVVSSGTLQIYNENSASLTLADGLFSVALEDIEDWTSDPASSEEKVVVVEKTEQDDTTQEKTTTTTTTSTSKSSPESAPYTIAWTLQQLMPNDSADKYYAERKKEIPVTVLENHEIRQGKTQYVEVTNGNLFRLTIAGDIHKQASNLHVALASTSIVGWDGQGKARLSNSSYHTQIQIANNKKEFVIGGLSKSSVVRSVTGFPFLKDIPVLGWIFSTETDTVKKSQFVLVASAELVNVKSTLPKEATDEIKGIRSKVEKSVQNPMGTLGFQQLLLDDNKK